MRCFIAIDIPKEIRAELTDLQKDLARRVDIRRGDVKWVEPEGMHLTLKFLGEVPDRQIVEVCNIVKEVAGRHPAFDFAVRKAGEKLGQAIEQYDDYRLGAVRASSITVYESQLTPQGPIYTPLGNFKFAD